MTVAWPDAQPVTGSSNNYSVHYLGQYPIAEMQCWDHHPDRPWHNQTATQKKGRFFCEPMPLEATADVLIYTALAAKATNDTSMASLYLPTLRTFAEYVEQNGRDPVLQLYTDDYLGPSALNANLALKSIISLGAYAQLCASLSLEEDSQRYRKLAVDYAKYWQMKTAGGREGATRRTYELQYKFHVFCRDSGESPLKTDDFLLKNGHVFCNPRYDMPGSFSAKTNLLFDRMLGTGLFSSEIAEKECAVLRETAGAYVFDVFCFVYTLSAIDRSLF